MAINPNSVQIQHTYQQLAEPVTSYVMSGNEIFLVKLQNARNIVDTQIQHIDKLATFTQLSPTNATALPTAQYPNYQINQNSPWHPHQNENIMAQLAVQRQMIAELERQQRENAMQWQFHNNRRTSTSDLQYFQPQTSTAVYFARNAQNMNSKSSQVDETMTIVEPN